jgi:beta-phosphoglucomutase
MVWCRQSIDSGHALMTALPFWYHPREEFMTGKTSLLFDLDGTMLDTDPLHIAAFQRLLDEYGRSITEDYYMTKIMGASIDAIMADLFPELPRSERLALGERKEEFFRNSLTGPLEPKAGLIDLIHWAKDNDLGICVVTNAPRGNAEKMLGGLGIIHLMDHILIGDELPNAKPDPSPYLEGMRRLGVGRERALAFEDSAPGIRSASGAGIYTFGMKGALDDTVLRQNGASDVINDFTDDRLWTKLRGALIERTCSPA